LQQKVSEVSVKTIIWADNTEYIGSEKPAVIAT